MAHPVICIYCKKRFDRDKEEAVKVKGNRYAHKKCADIPQSEKDKQIDDDKTKLDNYIMKLFGTDYVEPRIRKQLNHYKDEYGYSDSGMLKSLIYHYEIKNGDIKKAKGGVGIIPYIYKEAYNYYLSLWTAQQKNEQKIMIDYIPEVKEIIIPNPERKIKKRKLFTFLDEEELNNDNV